MRKLFFIPIIIGLLAVVASFYSQQKASHLKETGVKAVATIVDQRIKITESNDSRDNRRGRRKKEKSVFPIYEFTSTDGAVHRVDGSVGGSRVTMGKKCTVYYNPQDPDSEFTIDEDSGGPILGYVVGGIFMLVGVLLYRFTGKGKATS